MVKHTPPKDRETLSQIYHDFHFQYGITLSRWARLEEVLCSIFCDLCSLDPDTLGPSLFFSGRSFATRADLFAAAVRSSGLPEPEKALFRAILKKARQYSTARNAIAHGAPAHFVAKGYAYQGWRIKEPERAWELGGIGIDQLKEAEKSFLELSSICYMTNDVLSQRRLAKKRLKPTEWYLQQVQALPNDAYSPEQAPTPIES